MAYWFFTNKYINCTLYVEADSEDDEVVRKVEAAVEEIVKTTYGREMFDYFKSPIEVAHMRNKNPAGHSIHDTWAYTNGDIFLGTYKNLDYNLIHELPHLRYSMTEEGPSEKAERDYRSSP